MDLLNDLKDRELFNGSHEHICLVRFVFLTMLQKDLDETKETWNTHTIRAVKQSRCPSGKPDAMYILPHRLVYIMTSITVYILLVFNSVCNRQKYHHIVSNFMRLFMQNVSCSKLTLLHFFP